MPCSRRLKSPRQTPGWSCSVIIPVDCRETIRSRCQQIAVRPPARQSALNWLKEKHPDQDPDQLEQALDLAADAPLAASQLLDDDGLIFGTRVLEGLVAVTRGEGIQTVVSELWLADSALTWRWLAIWTERLLKAGQRGTRFRLDRRTGVARRAVSGGPGAPLGVSTSRCGTGSQQRTSGPSDRQMAARMEVDQSTRELNRWRRRVFFPTTSKANRISTRPILPFLINGGLFVPTKKQFKLGDEVLILLSLLGEERIAIPGQVAWITPPGSQHNIHSGVGVHFADSPEGTQAKNTISSLLAGMLESDKPTRTILNHWLVVPAIATIPGIRTTPFTRNHSCRHGCVLCQCRAE